MTVTRREFLRTVGSTTAAWLVTCGDNLPVLAASAVLDPDEDSAVVAIWCRVPGALAEVVVRAPGRPVTTTQIALDGEIGRLVLAGLAPDTVHDVAISVGGLALSFVTVTAASRHWIGLSLPVLLALSVMTFRRERAP